MSTLADSQELCQVDKDKKYIWAVEVTLPPDEKTRWVKPQRYMVVAPDMESAITLTKESYPSVTFIKIIRSQHVDEVLMGVIK